MAVLVSLLSVQLACPDVQASPLQLSHVDREGLGAEIFTSGRKQHSADVPGHRKDIPPTADSGPALPAQFLSPVLISGRHQVKQVFNTKKGKYSCYGRLSLPVRDKGKFL